MGVLRNGRLFSKPWHRFVCQEEGWTKEVCMWLMAVEHSGFRWSDFQRLVRALRTNEEDTDERTV